MKTKKPVLELQDVKPMCNAHKAARASSGCGYVLFGAFSYMAFSFSHDSNIVSNLLL